MDVAADVNRRQPNDRPPMEPCRCPACRACWRYTDGPSAGRCFFGGPFAGYRPVGSHPDAAPHVEI